MEGLGPTRWVASARPHSCPRGLSQQRRLELGNSNGSNHMFHGDVSFLRSVAIRQIHFDYEPHGAEGQHLVMRGAQVHVHHRLHGVSKHQLPTVELALGPCGPYRLGN